MHIKIKHYIKFGADGRSRTGTAKGHYPLKVACLPISPHRLILSLQIYSVGNVGLSDVSAGALPVTGKAGLSSD